MPSHIHILVVEDDNDSMTMLCHHLREIGYSNLTPASDAHEAMALLAGKPVDLIISDRYMPSMDGIEFYQALRDRPGWKDIPFLMVTSENRKDKIADAIHAGVRHYISKPVEPETLQIKIDRLLANQVKPPCPSA